MRRNPLYNEIYDEKAHQFKADPTRLYICEVCKIPKLAKAFFRSNNKSGVKFSNVCRICSKAKHSRDIRATDRKLKSDSMYQLERLEKLGPKPKGRREYNNWKFVRSILLSRAGLQDKRIFNIVDHVNRKIKHGKLTVEQAEYYIEQYYINHPNSRPTGEA